MDTEQIWTAALGELQLQMTQATFDTWLRDSKLLKYENGTCVVGVKSGYAKEWLEARLVPTIKRTLARLTGQAVEIDFVILAGDTMPVAKSEHLIIEALYGEERNRLIKPESGCFLPWYETDVWLPRLGCEFFCLVHVLRRVALNANSTGGVRSVAIEGEELAARLGVSERTIKNWLDVEPMPGEGWYRIRRTDPRRVALSEFIPKITYDSTGRRVIQVRMDTPLVPEDKQRLEEMVRARLLGDNVQSPAEEISAMIRSLDMSVEDGRAVRSMVLPIAKRIAALFDDEHSTKMYYRVLVALYRARRLDLFLEAVQVAMLDMYPGGNPGATFVTEIQQLGDKEGVSVGIGLGSNDDE